jgi:dipeptidyl aminopeptidase/acylaminoacyl peptidase/CubicO group peptidase (beta-lactamase class C family)
MHIDDLTEIAVPEQPTLSPDGSQIVYVLRTTDAASDRTVRRLWRVGAQSGAAEALTRGRSDTSPAWSPDGSRLAYLRADDGPAQLWVIAAHGGEPEQLTRLADGAGAPVWSPDGTRIAFSSWVDIGVIEGESEEARAKRAAAPVVIDRLDYRIDGVGALGTSRRHIQVVDVATGAHRQVTDGDWLAGDPAWSPDGTRLAFSANIGADTDLTLRSAAYVIDADDPRARPRLAGLESGSAGPVRWTANNDALLVIGHADAPVGHAALLRVPLDRDGGPAVDLSGSLDRNVVAGGIGYPGALVQLADGGDTALFCVNDRGCSHLYSVDVTGGEPRLVSGGEGRIVNSLSVSGSVAAVVISHATSYGEVVTLDLETGVERVRTSHGETLADVLLFPREERQFAISDGVTVTGWLIRDPEQTGRRPLLLDIHGGPHNAWNAVADETHLYHQELVSRGWAVLLVNPRGSDGYGAEFFNAVAGNWGAAEANDLLEPIDTLVAEGLADPLRLAIAGYSYGGYMTCYLTGRDQRFAAAVAGGVVSDLVSMVGTCDDAHLFSELELGGQYWQDRENYARMSPITSVENVRTPTLVVHGGADLTCPVGQAEQWHTALRELGVPTRLVLYPNASHAFILIGTPSHRLDFNRRVVEWVERFASRAPVAKPAPLDAAHWQRRLDDLARRHKVPGAQLGLLRLHEDGPDEVIQTASGVLNTTTGVPATTESLFQIGSISKVWTTTVVMQLVEEGRIDLDAPVVDTLPELRLSDPDATARVTLRHLLTHTSGIDGDLFADTGRGDDVLEKYVALLADLPLNHPLGATWSYCNAGFTVVGRIIEKLTGMTWDAALRTRLFVPLGLSHTVTLPEEALLFGTAVGHLAEPGSPAEPAPVWGLPRSLGPAGLISSTVADSLAFARLHLLGGLAADGTRVLTEPTAAAMAAKQADLPDKHTLGDSWGLGWIRYLWDGHRIIGHDGATIGQAAMLRLLPEQGLAVALLTNGGNAHDLYEDLFREIFAEVAEVAMPFPLAPPEVPAIVDIAPHVGVYERASVRVDVFDSADGPRLKTTLSGLLAELGTDPTEEYELVPVDTDLFAIRAPGDNTWTPVTFYSLPRGEKYVHFGARATPRVG